MEKRNCYFYRDYHEMGATIPSCTLERECAKCPCDNCTRFVSNDTVTQLAIAYVLVRQKEGDNK